MAEHLQIHPGRFFAAIVPVLIALVAVMLVNLPVSVTGGLLPAPLLALAPVYFWVLVRPDLMPPIAILAIGLFEDLLSGGPPGLWGAGFLAAYALADKQRDLLASLSGFGAVLGFAAAVLTATAVVYVLAGIIFQRIPPLAPVLLEAVMTTVFYPPMALLMGFVHRHVVGPMRGED